MALFQKDPKPHSRPRMVERPRRPGDSHTALLGTREYEDGSSEFAVPPAMARDATSVARRRPPLDLSIPLRGHRDFGTGNGEIAMPPTEHADAFPRHPALHRAPAKAEDGSPSLMHLLGLYFNRGG